MVKRFDAEGFSPEGYTLYAYAAVQVFAEAARRAGSTGLDALGEALHDRGGLVKAGPGVLERGQQQHRRDEAVAGRLPVERDDVPRLLPAERGAVLAHGREHVAVADVGRQDRDPHALHGAVICNQPSIVEYLIQQGAKVDAKNRLGWTPLMVAGGIYIANNRKDFPVAAGILRKAMSANSQPGK